MNVAQKRIQISSSEFEYLRKASFLSPYLAEVIRSAQPASDGSLSMNVSRKVAEGFRSAFTDQLAKSGFGVDYELTSEGRMLEELIDRFYVGDVT